MLTLGKIHAMKAFALLLSGALSVVTVLAQQVQPITVPLGAVQQVRALEHDFFPNLQTLEMPHPARTLTGIRSRGFQGRTQQDSLVQLGLAAPPQMNLNFNGNLYNFRTPNDNDLAIANNGQLVSVTNSIIYFYDAPNQQFEKTTSLANFAASLGYTESKYDPKVIYDPAEDKFVMVFLNGNLDSTSRIIVAFSETNDPLGNWNLYALSGNPIDNDTWSDFPNIGLSTDELFLTFNTFTNGSVNNSGFEEACIWQINKYDGYNGDSLDTRYFSGLNDQGKAFFNITPIIGGSNLYGPEMHFLSNRNLHSDNDTFFVFTIDNTIDNNGQISVQRVFSDQHYGEPPGALMPGGDTLDCNDARILGGFFEDGIIQFVGNTVVGSTGRPGMYHGILEGLPAGTPSIQLNIISDTVDLAYPNIAYVGTGPGDQSAILVVNYSSETVFPASASFFYDGKGGYSSLSTIKEGISSVDVLTSPKERWGDYADVQPKYDEPGIAWSATSYARSGAHFTWIAQLVRPFGVDVPDHPTAVAAQVAPNPTQHQVVLSFTLARPEQVTVALYNTQGQRVALLLADHVPAGTHQFSCRIGHLPAGLYVLQGRGATGEALFSKRVVKQ